MNDDKILIEALRRLSVQTGSIACLGCEYEYDCGIHGCAIICAARERLEELTASPEVAKFSVYFDSIQKYINVMRGIIASMDDETTAAKLRAAMQKLGALLQEG